LRAVASEPHCDFCRLAALMAPVAVGEIAHAILYAHIVLSAVSGSIVDRILLL